MNWPQPNFDFKRENRAEKINFTEMLCLLQMVKTELLLFFDFKAFKKHDEFIINLEWLNDPLYPPLRFKLKMIKLKTLYSNQ